MVISTADVPLSSFWNDKDNADKILKEYRELKSGLCDEYKDSCAVFTVISGVGGDDAEDFARMLFNMYLKYAEKRNIEVCILSKTKMSMEDIKTFLLSLKERNF